MSYHSADITDKSSILSILNQIRPVAIIHTASPVGSAFKGSHELYRKVNIEGTRNLLACADELGCVKAFVYTKVYGPDIPH